MDFRTLFALYLDAAQKAYDAFRETGGVQTAEALAAKNERSRRLEALQACVRAEGFGSLAEAHAAYYQTRKAVGT